MNARWIVVLSMLACSGKKQDRPGDHDPATAAKPAPATKCDADADFVHVDRDQLAAVCLEAELPSTYWRPWHGALKTADGRRLPWLALQIDGRVGDGDPKVTHARS